MALDADGGNLQRPSVSGVGKPTCSGVSTWLVSIGLRCFTLFMLVVLVVYIESIMCMLVCGPRVALEPTHGGDVEVQKDAHYARLVARVSPAQFPTLLVCSLASTLRWRRHNLQRLIWMR